MAAALAAVSVQRGYDPREFALVVAGGAGPLHAAALARELDIPLLLIPRESSVFCTAGMLISDLKHDYVRTYTSLLSALKLEELRKISAQLTTVAAATLAQEGVAESAREFEWRADLRYVGQFHEVDINIPDPGSIEVVNVDAIAAAFHTRHENLYGYAMMDAPLEVINIRLTARGKTSPPRHLARALGPPDADHARCGQREIYLDSHYITVPVYAGFALNPGNVIAGPAIVVQPTTTIVVPQDFALRCDEYSNYVMHRKQTDVAALCRRLRGEYDSEH